MEGLLAREQGGIGTGRPPRLRRIWFPAAGVRCLADFYGMSYPSSAIGVCQGTDNDGHSQCQCLGTLCHRRLLPLEQQG